MPMDACQDPPFRVLFLLPVAGGTERAVVHGGIHSVVQEVQGLQSLGIPTQVAVPAQFRDRYLASYPGLGEGVFFFFDDRPHLIDHAASFDVAVATIFSSVRLLKRVWDNVPGIIPAYYIQDYEPWFCDKGSKLEKEALASYTLIPELVCFAKTDWIRRTVQAHHEVNVHKVLPSLDTSIYRPALGRRQSAPPVRLAAMIRPTTARRAPQSTMGVLKRVKRRYGNAVHICTFGCSPSEPGFLALPRDFEFDHRGTLRREEVAELLTTSHVFIDLSTYQAFGRTGLEAMACGCATLLPRKGGTDEYAVHEHNTLLVDTHSLDAVLSALHRLVTDADLRHRLSTNATLTASTYSVHRAAICEAQLFAEEIRQQQSTLASKARAGELLSDAQDALRREMLRWVPPDAGVIVELGCGDGALGHRFKKINPRCRYFGVESDADAARLAATSLDKVVAASPDHLSLSDLDPELDGVDCLVYSQTLERLTQPAAALRRQTTWLKPEGVVLAAVANEENWTQLPGLIQQAGGAGSKSQAAPRHAGLSRPKRLKAMFQDAGLTPLDIQVFRPQGATFGAFQRAMRPALHALDVNAREFAEATGTLGLTSRAVRSPPRRRVLVQADTLAPVAACNEIRVHGPNRMLATIPGIRIVEAAGIVTSKAARREEQKLLLWQRPVLLLPDGLSKLRRLIQAGYLIVIEFDDDPARWPAIEENDFLTFRGAHCVQTSTPLLAERLREHNPNVAVFPNQIAELPPRRQRTETDITLFFGALNREQDWLPIMPVLNEVAADCDTRVQFRVLHDRAFFEALRTDRKTFDNTCPYDRYQQLLSGSDIALLPLAPTDFNRCKSDLKFIECAAQGAVALASPTVYEHSIVPEETGLIYGSPEEFGEQLRRLVADEALRKRLADNAYRWVKENRLLSQHYRERHHWYLSMLDALPRLTEQLYERIPALRPDETRRR